MLEIKIKDGYENKNINKNINYLELIKALEELGIHTKKAGNPFYFILNFKAINYCAYYQDGFGYEVSKYILVEENAIVLDAGIGGVFSFSSIFGINLEDIYNSNYGGTICKIIGYWTDNDEY